MITIDISAPEPERTPEPKMPEEQGAAAPEGWSDCPRIEVDCTDPDAASLSALHRAWQLVHH